MAGRHSAPDGREASHQVARDAREAAQMIHGLHQAHGGEQEEDHLAVGHQFKQT